MRGHALVKISQVKLHLDSIGKQGDLLDVLVDELLRVAQFADWQNEPFCLLWQKGSLSCDSLVKLTDL